MRWVHVACHAVHRFRFAVDNEYGYFSRSIQARATPQIGDFAKSVDPESLEGKDTGWEL